MLIGVVLGMSEKKLVRPQNAGRGAGKGLLGA